MQQGYMAALALCLGAALISPLVAASPTTDLVKKLFENYDKDVLPSCENEQVQVKLGIAIRGILDVDEPRQIATANVWFRWDWRDCSLLWDPHLYANITHLVVPATKLWIPDITLMDSAGDGLEDLQEKGYRPKINHNGMIQYMAPAIITFTCKMDITYFPYDRQACRMKFASWSYNGMELDVTNRSTEGDMSVFVDNGEWNLIGVPVKRHVSMYSCCPEPYPDVTFYLIIQREYLYYFFNLVMPCVLITAIALLVFALPVESGEKISLGITVLLSLCVFLLMVADKMPATSETVPLIAQYFAATIAMVSVSTALTVFVINVHFRGGNGYPVPRILRILLIDGLGRLVCARKCRDTKDKESTKREESVLSEEMPLLRNNDKIREDINNSTGNGAMLEVMYGIQKQLNEIAERMRGADKDQEIENEWRLLAIVLDRTFFVISSCVTVIGSLVILVPSSIKHNIDLE